jgi:hypothetical protein
MIRKNFLPFCDFLFGFLMMLFEGQYFFTLVKANLSMLSLADVLGLMPEKAF